MREQPPIESYTAATFARKLATVLAMIGGFYAFFAMATLVLVPAEVSKNNARLNDVMGAIEYKLAHGQLPEQYRYNGVDGSNAMWVDTLDDCSEDFHPPRTDQFVIAFWQGDWWNCYAYPSGTTSIETTTMQYMQGPTGEIITESLAVGLMLFAAAYLIRRFTPNQPKMSRLAASIWFGPITFLFLFYIEIGYETVPHHRSTDASWSVLMDKAFLGHINDPVIRSLEIGSRIIPFKNSSVVWPLYEILFFISYIGFWSALYYATAALLNRVATARGRSKTVTTGN